MTELQVRSQAVTHQQNAAVATYGQWITVLRAIRPLVAKAAFPVLKYMRVEPTPWGLHVAAMNSGLDTSIQFVIPGAGADGPMLLPPDALWKTVRDIAGRKGVDDETPVTIARPDGENLRVAGFDRCIEISETAQVPPVEDYPALPSIHGPILGYVNAAALQSGWRFASRAAGDDATLPMLTGVQLSVGDTVHRSAYRWGAELGLAAIDRYRFATATVDFARTSNHRGEVQLLIPATVGRHLSWLWDRVTVRLNGDPRYGHVVFSDTKWVRMVITSRLVDATFPPVQELIPDSPAYTWRVQRSQLIGDVKAAASGKRENEPVRIDFGEHRVRVEGCAERGVESKQAGDVRFGFNPDFLLDALDSFVSDMVEVAADTANKPVLFIGDIRPDVDGVHLLVPVRL